MLEILPYVSKVLIVSAENSSIHMQFAKLFAYLEPMPVIYNAEM